MGSGNSDLPEGWEILPDYMTTEEKRLWECERDWRKRAENRKAKQAALDALKKPGPKPKPVKPKTYYERKKEADPRPKLICIFGPSGSGKTAASFMLRKAVGVHVICSYTTRPKRPGETDGTSHHFVTEVPPREEMLAYTKFGGYEYWALKSDVKAPATVYVIDEAGINDLMQYKDIYKIVIVRIECKEIIRFSRGVSKERIERDRDRVKLKGRPFTVIDNNKTPHEFRAKLVSAYKRIMKL